MMLLRPCNKFLFLIGKTRRATATLRLARDFGSSGGPILFKENWDKAARARSKVNEGLGERFRTDWGREFNNESLLKNTSEHYNRVASLVNETCELLKEQVADRKKKGLLITAWLVTDNVLTDICVRFMGLPLELLSVDTLHLFPETLKVAEDMKKAYPQVPIRWGKPQRCETLEDFNARHGTAANLSPEDFDYRTKIEPLQRLLEEVERGREGGGSVSVLLTGRRCDQGKLRTTVPLVETQKNTLNPMAKWTWDDVLTYAQHFDIPVNELHKRVMINSQSGEIGAKERDRCKNFLEVTLERPYFHYYSDVLNRVFGKTTEPVVDENGTFSNFYVWKSFGDTHTSVPVTLHESERDGRFAHRVSSECGIHTRLSTSRKAPHGGTELVDLLSGWDTTDPSMWRVDYEMELTERETCDLELLTNGGFTPLRGFMNREEYDSVLEDMRLPEGMLWGVPVTLDTRGLPVKEGQRVLLKASRFGGDIAILEVNSVFKVDKRREAEKVAGTHKLTHPYRQLLEGIGETRMGGTVRAMKVPTRRWLPKDKVKTPAELRKFFESYDNTIAFQCRNPLHKAHVAVFTKANISSHSNLRNGSGRRSAVVVHPAIGPSKDDDFDASVRIPTYEVLRPHLSQHQVHIDYFPYQMRLVGPREALQHMICRKNYGFTHMVIGRDHAGCKDTLTGREKPCPNRDKCR